MTLDEVVAYNVRRIREEKGLTITEVARELGVGRHLVYDFERPRKGSTQRQFLWSDLVALCYVLDTTLFELVLPPADVFVEDLPKGETVSVRMTEKFYALPDELKDRLFENSQTTARSYLGWVLFAVDGANLDSRVFKELAERVQKEEERRAEVQREILEEMNRTSQMPGPLAEEVVTEEGQEKE